MSTFALNQEFDEVLIIIVYLGFSVVLLIVLIPFLIFCPFWVKIEMI